MLTELLGVDGRVRRADAVGIGSYRIDLHPSTAGDNYIDVASVPYEIPLGALLPVRTKNRLPAGKNIGTTHLTNGCLRLHPVEWNVGEVAGLLAAFAVREGVEPEAVREDGRLFEDFARVLDAAGVERRWPEVRGY
ncbi:FAD-dependent oxidoreductase [Amycolatopsis sp. A133]|uniref:FAD-dependent oxidoreductase n=1 Tax=Amycolatopsis sp. A133 TaxID=3064472 RepID=UPI0027F33070|nr:FAD-dependent oxidoreductase [Amycolatopsis sp. A133]MDQ7803757.1 FAD-dependent oxidoreductase [Amycolatopsis sp. A133]